MALEFTVFSHEYLQSHATYNSDDISHTPLNCVNVVELKNSYKQMTGVLWMLDPINGQFPLGSEPRNTERSHICNRTTISHW